MEGDDDRTPIGVQSLGQDTGEKGLEVFKLMVDGDAQRLKDACGRVCRRMSAAGGVQGVVDRFDQLARGADRRAAAATHNRARDRARGRLLAEAEEQVRQPVLVERGEEIGSRSSLRRVESHVQRSVCLKAESAAEIGQLIGRKSQVEQHTVDPFEAELIENFRQLGIAGLFQDATRIVQNFGRPSEHHWVAIEADQFSGGTKRIKKGTAMAAGSDRSIHHDQSLRDSQGLNDFPHKDGTVNGRAPVSRGSRRIRHSGGLMNEEWFGFADSIRPASAG